MYLLDCVFDHIFPTILAGVCTYFIYKFLNCFIIIKKKAIWKLPVCLSIFILVKTYIYLNEYFYETLLYMLLFALAVIFAYQGTFVQKISVVLLLSPLILSVNLLVESLAFQLWLLSGENYVINLLVDNFFLLVRILIWWVIYRFFREKVINCRSFLTNRMWIALDIVALAPLVSMVSLALLAPDDIQVLYPANIACIVTGLGTIYLAGYAAESIKTKLENQNLKMQQAYYSEVEHNQKEIRKLRHDMNHHLSVIATLAEGNEKEKLQSYFQQLSVQLAGEGRMFSNNSVVNAIINAKYNQVMDHNIDAFFNIDIDNMLAIDDVSLCSIFANTIDNALEAVLKMPDDAKRKISVKARYTNGYFSYEITNTKSHAIKKGKEGFITSKTDKKMHGYGISNVESIVKQYGGTLNISYSEDTFCVIILIGGV